MKECLWMTKERCDLIQWGKFFKLQVSTIKLYDLEIDLNALRSEVLTHNAIFSCAVQPYRHAHTHTDTHTHIDTDTHRHRHRHTHT